MVKCNYYPEMVSSCSIKIVINFYFTVEILMQIIRIHTSKEFARSVDFMGLDKT